MLELYFQMMWTSDVGIHSIFQKMKVRYWKSLKKHRKQVQEKGQIQAL